MSISATGGGLRSVDEPAVPRSQRSQAASAEVITRTLAFSTSDYSGCGVAGCTSGTLVNQKQGLVLTGLYGEHPKLVTRGGFDYEPTFSPDGTLIAYLSRRKASWSPYNVAVDDIALMTGTGHQLGVLIEPGNGQAVQDLMWSPDSRSLAYVRTGDDGSERLVIRSTHSRRAQVFRMGQPLRELAWSPDGSAFVGVGDRQNAPGVPPSGDDLWLVSARTGIERRLTHFGSGPTPSGSFCAMTGGVSQRLSEPSWSPDSRQIAFISSYAYGAEFGWEYDLRVVTARTGAVRVVFHPSPMRCAHRGARYIIGSFRRVDVLGWM